MGFSSIQKTASTGSSTTGALVGANSLQPNLCQSVVCSMFFTGLELTAKRNVLIQLKKHYYVLLQNKKNMLYRVAWFYAEPCRAQKHAQEDKKKRRQAELSQKSVLIGELPIWKTKNQARDQGTVFFLSFNLTSILGPERSI